MRRHHPFNAVYDTREELYLGTCDSSEVGGVRDLVNTSLSMNIDSFEQNGTFTIKEMWTNTGFDNVRRLRADIKL
uniref:Neur_chan_LBD domain-containing protein n=1 Tax=Angiostrongylus cantonensis TaxID=6313 RepID=A0A0K0DRR7_ANGCA